MAGDNPAVKTAKEEEGTQEKPRVLDYRHILVVLTFPGVVPVEFVFRRQLSKELKTTREEFFGLTEAEQAEKRKAFRITMLSKLITEEPSGVPDWSKGDLEKSFLEFFNREENEDLLGWVWGQYQMNLYPKELMSSLLE